MTYIKQSVRRAAGSPGLAITPRDSITLIDVDDIAYFPARNSKGVEIEEDITLRPGCYAVTVYGTPGTFVVTSAAEGDPDQTGFTPQVEFAHPGNSLEVREFKTNWLNKKIIAIVRYCGGKKADLIGSPCNPCRLTPSYTGNNESNTNTMTIAQISRGEDIAVYSGTVPEEEPVAVVEAGATEITYTAEGQYQLSAGEATIATIEGGAHGALITLVGTEGAAPKVEPVEGKILLKDGAAFVGSSGSQLTLRAFAAGAGKIIWIEQSRHIA